MLVSQGQNIADAIRQIGVSEVTYYRWRQELEIAMTESNQNQGGQQTQQPGQKPGQGGQQGGGQQKPDQQQQQPGQKPGQPGLPGQQGGQKK